MRLGWLLLDNQELRLCLTPLFFRGVPVGLAYRRLPAEQARQFRPVLLRRLYPLEQLLEERLFLLVGHKPPPLWLGTLIRSVRPYGSASPLKIVGRPFRGGYFAMMK